MIVLPMAGYGSRFSKAGYTQPKYMLPVEGKPVLEHVISGFSPLLDDHTVLLVARKEQDITPYIPELEEKTGARIHLAQLDKPTEGQAETVHQGIVHHQGQFGKEPLFIFNIDTYHTPFTLPTHYSLQEIDGYLEVFSAPGDHWSFARPASLAIRPFAVCQVTEKQRISNLCSSGLYYFRTAELFDTLYQEQKKTNTNELQGGERYVAPLYQLAINAGCDIRYHKISQESIQCAGTPIEYEALIRKSV